MKGRLSREKWAVFSESPGGQSYYAERYVNGELEQRYVSAHCLACAKTEVLSRYGGQVDLRGWHMAASMCGAFLRATAKAVDDEKDMEECAHCEWLANPEDLVDDAGLTVKRGGRPEECIKCPECSQVFRAEETEEKCKS